MKKKRLPAMLVLLVCLAALAACGRKTDVPETTAGEDLPLQTVDASAYQFEGEYVDIPNKLTWEGIQNLPMKRPDMTQEEMRQAVVEFYLFSKNFYWISGGEAEYHITQSQDNINVRPGDIYRGLPYVGLGNGNIYRMMDYMDPATGVVDVENALITDVLFGNQCSCSAYWAWTRVINSNRRWYTMDMVAANGVVPLGEHTYDLTIDQFTSSYGTRKIVTDNGHQVMFESYAKIKPGDGLVLNNGSGHIIIATGETVVVRQPDGTIDPAKSYIIYSDQNSPRYSGKTDAGDKFTYYGARNSKQTFQRLYNNTYVPFTFREYLGEDPVEETEVFCTHRGDTITKEQLFSTKVCANYPISDAYAAVYNALGAEVCKVVVRTMLPGIYQVHLQEKSLEDQDDVHIWGSWADLDPNQEYAVKIYVQLSTGERPVLWEGKLAQ